jgi:hypothetical protein
MSVYKTINYLKLVLVRRGAEEDVAFEKMVKVKRVRKVEEKERGVKSKKRESVNASEPVMKALSTMRVVKNQTMMKIIKSL